MNFTKGLYRLYFITIVLLGFGLNVFAFQSSVLSSGEWYKIGVVKDGVYKIDQNFLQSIGLEIANLDPKKIRIFGNGGKMLPQKNSDPRAFDLIENAIFVSGEDDGVFNSSDQVIFFASGPNVIEFEGSEINYQKNNYSDTSYYFLNINQQNGLRITANESIVGNFSMIENYNDIQVHEIDEINKLQQLITFFAGSGREWYGEVFLNQLSQSFPFNFEGLQNSQIKLITALMAESPSPSSFKIGINDFTIGEFQIGSVPDTRYGIKGVDRIDTFSIPSMVIGGLPSEIIINLEYLPASSGGSTGYLNYLALSAQRKLSLYGDQTIFRSLESLSNPISTFVINNFSATYTIWNLTNKYNPAIQNHLNGEFSTETSDLNTFVVFDQSLISTPVFFGKVSNQNIKALENVEFLIITHPTFESEARRLADFRMANDNLTSAVVTTSQIFNEFSSGLKDPTAIRDFVKYLFDKPSIEKLKFLLLFGRTTYDYKDRTGGIENFVPTYLSRNSLDPLRSYSSDDYFGFLESDEGEWVENTAGDETLDIGVGRLPVKTFLEAQLIVDKIIGYSSVNNALGKWRNDIVFIADDGDNNTHQGQADLLADFVEQFYPAFLPKKFYLDAFEQIKNPGSEISPEAKNQLNETIENGAFIVNFTGHGGEVGWTDEDILRIPMIEEWSNTNTLPLFVTATCEFGRHDDPFQVSGGELTVLNPNGGGIALVTTARPVFSSTNFSLNQAFYNSVFQKDADNQYLRIGEIFKLTKNSSLNGPNNRNFSLLGDPSLRLSYPTYQIKLIEINGNSITTYQDTLKSQSIISVKGILADHNDVIVNDFNGILNIAIFDKAQKQETLGSDGPVFLYLDRTNTIFRGKASITNGSFEFDFVVPKDIDFKFGEAKISLYAESDNSRDDGHGASVDLIIGGSNQNAIHDNSPPQIEAYLENLDFVNGDITSNTPLLLVHLSDENGINISNAGIGHEIVAILDNENEIVLNQYFENDIDDFTSGWVNFIFEELQPGPHQLRIKGWDNLNNSAEISLNFVVSNENPIIINDLKNFPNPFYNRTMFSFEHSREGENLEIELQIINRNGQLLTRKFWTINNSPSIIQDIEWDGHNNLSKKVDEGLYVYRLIVRSLRDGAKSQRYNRLVLIN